MKGATMEQIAEVFEAEYTALLNYFKQRVGHADAEDLLSETFYLVCNKREEYDPEKGSLNAWVQGFARVHLMSWDKAEERRKRAKERFAARRVQLVEESFEDLSVEATLAEIWADALTDALSNMSAKGREVLFWRFGVGFMPTQIAALLGMYPPTVRSLICRALKNLYGELEYFALEMGWRMSLEEPGPVKRSDKADKADEDESEDGDDAEASHPRESDADDGHQDDSRSDDTEGDDPGEEQ